MTPEKKRSPFRQKLIDTYYQALRAQSYPYWKAIVLGEKECTIGQFEYIYLPDLPRAERLVKVKEILEGKRFLGLYEETDYIIKLDDDDLISPDLLQTISVLDFDLYYDRYHTFYDVSSGSITQQYRNWTASSCVHRKEHIMSDWNKTESNGVGKLLYTDHSKTWLHYYRGKKIIIAPKEKPVYLRVLSPSSISAGSLHERVQRVGDISMVRYYEYLKGFGTWKPAKVNAFDRYIDDLRQAWEIFSGHSQQALPVMKSGKWEKLFNIFRERESRI